MLSNEAMGARCQFLLQAITTCQSNTEHVNTTFKANAKAASDAIDAALHANNLSTTQELFEQVTKELPDGDKAEFMKLVEQNKLPTVWESLVGKDTAEHINKATSFLGFAIGAKGLSSIKAGLTTDVRLGFSYISTMSRASALRIAATDAFAAHVSKVAEIGALEQDIALNEIVGAQATQLRAELQVAMNEELVLAETSYTLRGAAFEAEGFAAAAEGEVLAARTTASAAMRAGIYGALIGAGILIGCWFYSRYKESEEAEKLKTAIGHLAASRLYAQSIFDSSEAFAENMNAIKHIAEHYKPDQPDSYKSRVDDLISDLKTGQVVDMDKVLKEVQDQDAKAGQLTDASEDPKTVKDLEDIHAAMSKKYLEEHPDTPMVSK